MLLQKGLFLFYLICILGSIRNPLVTGMALMARPVNITGIKGIFNSFDSEIPERNLWVAY